MPPERGPSSTSPTAGWAPEVGWRPRSDVRSLPSAEARGPGLAEPDRSGRGGAGRVASHLHAARRPAAAGSGQVHRHSARSAGSVPPGPFPCGWREVSKWPGQSRWGLRRPGVPHPSVTSRTSGEVCGLRVHGRKQTKGTRALNLFPASGALGVLKDLKPGSAAFSVLITSFVDGLGTVFCFSTLGKHCHDLLLLASYF